ncbi:hypothetical protein [Ferrimonas lipolytica]|uniref:Uncharacterized protein n=1 Tax=Ferrimonas lipolytica TaxID=2724191 RepID=A0A6H1UH33_9GAMM|nr:hypothetical protein [Ferrimonas lipolytica]QIZ77102.1 hypothetical protein HER31_09570 [Ferrimonas lipolytica]
MRKTKCVVSKPVTSNSWGEIPTEKIMKADEAKFIHFTLLLTIAVHIKMQFGYRNCSGDRLISNLLQRFYNTANIHTPTLPAKHNHFRAQAHE